MKNIPLNTAASFYEISETELLPLRGGHFAQVYGFTRDGRNYVLRLSPFQKIMKLVKSSDHHDTNP